MMVVVEGVDARDGDDEKIVGSTNTEDDAPVLDLLLIITWFGGH